MDNADNVISKAMFNGMPVEQIIPLNIPNGLLNKSKTDLIEYMDIAERYGCDTPSELEDYIGGLHEEEYIQDTDTYTDLYDKYDDLKGIEEDKDKLLIENKDLQKQILDNNRVLHGREKVREEYIIDFRDRHKQDMCQKDHRIAMLEATVQFLMDYGK